MGVINSLLDVMWKGALEVRGLGYPAAVTPQDSHWPTLVVKNELSEQVSNDYPFTSQTTFHIENTTPGNVNRKFLHLRRS